ncbi:MAG: nucleotide exchange factor GrpE [Kiritimatiellae bacterium]|nr:nucleotide exchange factor GrpE [Kiritimatiellia bacterium]
MAEEEKKKEEETEKAEPAAESPKDEAAGEKGEDSAAEKEEAKAASEKPVEPDWKDRYARLLADFDNFKKRVARDREDTYRFAEADILEDLLPAADNLALAIASAKDADGEFVKGVKLVYETFLAAMKKHDAEPFDSKGEKLDIEKMEAIATLPSDTVEEGSVSEEVKRGWMHKGKVLRAAQVVVSSGKKKD